MYMSDKNHAKHDAFHVEDETNDINLVLLDGHHTKKRSEEDQVCIYELNISIIFL